MMRKVSYFKNDKMWWFRIYGYGLAGTSIKSDWLPFSIRNGYKKTIRIFGYYIEFLKPDEDKYRNIKKLLGRRLGGKK